MDDVDENLKASGEVEIPTNWQEQETHRTIEVRAEEEEETMVDLGPIDLSEGRISEGMENGTSQIGEDVMENGKNQRSRQVGEDEILSRVKDDEIISNQRSREVGEDEILSRIIEDKINKQINNDESEEVMSKK